MFLMLGRRQEKRYRRLIKDIITARD